MPFVRPAVACLLALLMLLGGTVCAPMTEAAPRTEAAAAPPCHGDGSIPANDAAPNKANAPSSCLRCPLCATVVPAPVPSVSARTVTLAVYVPATPSAPQAPVFAPPTPPPQV